MSNLGPTTIHGLVHVLDAYYIAPQKYKAVYYTGTDVLCYSTDDNPTKVYGKGIDIYSKLGNITIKSEVGSLSESAKTEISRESTNSSISDTAYTNISRTSTTGDIADTVTAGKYTLTAKKAIKIQSESETIDLESKTNTTIKVGGNYSNTVDGTTTDTFKGTYTKSVTGVTTETYTGKYTGTFAAGVDRTISSGGLVDTITGDSSVTFNNNLTHLVKGNESRTVNGSYTNTVYSYTLSSSTTLSASSTGNMTVSSGGTLDVTATGASNMTAKAGHSETVTGNASHTATGTNSLTGTTTTIGATVKLHLDAAKIVLKSTNYGASLPSSGEEGQLFFKIVDNL